jgi:DNA-binding Lrp family transcriptional regulator
MTDHKILAHLSKKGDLSSRELAQILGMPHSTVDYRLKSLRAKKVICGSLHEIKGVRIGLTNFLVQIGMEGLPQDVHLKFYDFCRYHPNIPHYSHEFGAWEYTLGVAVESHQTVNEVTNEIHREFGAHVGFVKILPMFNAIKVEDYPAMPTNEYMPSVANLG